MADDDESLESEDFEDDAELEEAPEELEEVLEGELEEDLDEGLEEEFEEEFDEDLGEDEEEDEDLEEAAPRRRAGDDEDDDEDLLAPDDVEADLDTILKDRLVTAEESEDEEDETTEVEDRSAEGDRLQPKRADEQLCPSCFLLVRRNAPGCPVGDDSCPLFS